jgi:hypothetical protein
VKIFFGEKVTRFSSFVETRSEKIFFQAKVKNQLK